MLSALIAALDTAYAWLCRQRRDYPADADVWHLRFHWARERTSIVAELRDLRFRFGPMQVLKKRDGETLHLWRARDALVMKALALVVQPLLRLSPRCVHVKGHGGLKAAVREVQQRLPEYKFVLRTDVQGYYENIDQEQLLGMLADEVEDVLLMGLLHQAINRTVERGGLYRDIDEGISRGCPLSPMLGALYLRLLDERLGTAGAYYVRYMDDIVVLTRTRWRLRRAVRTLNETFDELKLDKHPDKTFIGRIERGFDFLGYHFSRQHLRLAARTVTLFAARLRRLYEQQKTAPEGADLLGEYVCRWLRWTRAGLRKRERSNLMDRFRQAPAEYAQSSKSDTDQKERGRSRYAYPSHLGITGSRLVRHCH